MTSSVHGKNQKDEYFNELRIITFPDIDTIPAGPSRYGRRDAVPETEFIAAEFNSPSTKVAASKTDGSLRFWLLKSMEPSGTPPFVVANPHLRPVESISWNGASDIQVATVGYDNTVKIWDGFHGKLLKEINIAESERLSVVKWTSDGKFIVAVGRAAAKIYILSVQDGYKIVIERQFNSAVNDICWNNGHEFIFAGLANGDIEVLRFDNNELTTVTILQGNSSSINTLRYDTRGRFLFSGARDGTVAFWSLDDLTAMKIINDVDEPIHSLDVTKDGTYLSVCFQDQTPTKLFDINSLMEYHSVEESKNGARASPVFRFCTSRTTYLYSTTKGKLMISAKDTNKEPRRDGGDKRDRRPRDIRRDNRDRDGDRDRERERERERRPPLRGDRRGPGDRKREERDREAFRDRR